MLHPFASLGLAGAFGGSALRTCPHLSTIERKCILEAAALIEKHEGKKPMEWLAPYLVQTHDSLDLLKEAGYRYMMDWSLDNQPVWFRTKRGPILSVPYAHDLNDSQSA